tara:strand:+ start:151 stop:393 length:243 start_codon:yes stop_codon:yes gene_type:complete
METFKLIFGILVTLWLGFLAILILVTFCQFILDKFFGFNFLGHKSPRQQLNKLATKWLRIDEKRWEKKFKEEERQKKGGK